MLYSVKELGGWNLGARDGDIGRVREAYFDDRRWVVRHLVADTGGWLTGRRVLVSPHAVERLDAVHGRIELSLTREQIRQAPDFDTDRPVSRVEEMRHYDYYGYPYYWQGAALWGLGAYPLPAMAAMAGREEDVRAAREAADAARERSDPHLRSSKEVTGYGARASDRDIGRVDDLLVDERSWQIRGIVVDTREWFPGGEVIVPPDWIVAIEWSERQVQLQATRSDVQACPGYQPGRGVSESEVQRVQRRFERSE